MKTASTMLLGLTTLAIAGAGVPRVAAGDGGWSTAGKVLTGVVAGSILARAFEPAPTYVAYPAPTYYTVPTVVVSPPPPPTVAYVPAAPVVVYPPPVVVVPVPTIYARPVPVVIYPFGGYGYRPHFRHRW